MKIIGIERKIPGDILKVARGVRRWALKQNNGSSYGMCTTSSSILSHKLQDMGRKAELRKGYVLKDGFQNGHCWLTYRGMILDVTADQFNDFADRFGDVPDRFGNVQPLDHIFFRAIVWVPAHKVRSIFID